MLIDDIINENASCKSYELKLIREQCSEFLQIGHPLFRLLSTSYNDFAKIKVRKKDKQDPIVTAYNKAFEQQFFNLRQRAIFAYPQIPQITEHDIQQNVEPFYIFPINGFKFLYSREVKNSGRDYQQVINTLFENLGNNQRAIEIVTDVLKYTYCHDNLIEGILSNSEIIIYNIPFYYAIRVEKNPDYKQIIKKLNVKGEKNV